MQKKLESKKFLEGGGNAEKNRGKEILGLCGFKKLVILRGGPVKKTHPVADTGKARGCSTNTSVTD